ncbi:hypothetical protein PGO_091740 [Plasmodium gonderi]|uniref:Uncharacterized protein n=1 Tax=Plasmodium gonderi TaxID=77519 RepID=A0A1Y1JLP3_PLAGO|nr:hypothetical protein PGO_091740 [Plasmodium gonderi]GAW80974.1 hypothetical protein PGO_091740 [Plasmodium gonderi]
MIYLKLNQALDGIRDELCLIDEELKKILHKENNNLDYLSQVMISDNCASKKVHTINKYLQNTSNNFAITYSLQNSTETFDLVCDQKGDSDVYNSANLTSEGREFTPEKMNQKENRKREDSTTLVRMKNSEHVVDSTQMASSIHLNSHFNLNETFQTKSQKKNSTRSDTLFMNEGIKKNSIDHTGHKCIQKVDNLKCLSMDSHSKNEKTLDEAVSIQKMENSNNDTDVVDASLETREVGEVEIFNKVKKASVSNEVKEADASNEVRKESASNEVKKASASNEVRKESDSSEVKETETSNELKDMDESNEVRKMSDPNVVKKANASNEVKKANASNEVRKVSASNEVKETETSKEVKDMDESNEVRKMSDSNEVRKMSASNEVKEADVCNNVRKGSASNEVKKESVSNEVKKASVSNEVKETDVSNKVRKMSASNEVRKESASNEVKKGSASNEVKKANASNEVRKVSASNEVKETETSNELKDMDESNEVRKMSDSNEVRKEIASNEVKETDAYNNVRKGSASNEVKEADVSNKVRKMSASNEVKEADAYNNVRKEIASNEVKKDSASNEVRKGSASNEVKEADMSNKARKMSASNNAIEMRVSIKNSDHAPEGQQKLQKCTMYGKENSQQKIEKCDIGSSENDVDQWEKDGEYVRNGEKEERCDDERKESPDDRCRENSFLNAIQNLFLRNKKSVQKESEEKQEKEKEVEIYNLKSESEKSQSKEFNKTKEHAQNDNENIHEIKSLNNQKDVDSEKKYFDMEMQNGISVCTCVKSEGEDIHMNNQENNYLDESLSMIKTKLSVDCVINKRNMTKYEQKSHNNGGETYDCVSRIPNLDKEKYTNATISKCVDSTNTINKYKSECNTWGDINKSEEDGKVNRKKSERFSSCDYMDEGHIMNKVNSKSFAKDYRNEMDRKVTCQDKLDQMERSRSRNEVTSNAQNGTAKSEPIYISSKTSEMGKDMEMHNEGESKHYQHASNDIDSNYINKKKSERFNTIVTDEANELEKGKIKMNEEILRKRNFTGATDMTNVPSSGRFCMNESGDLNEYNENKSYINSSENLLQKSANYIPHANISLYSTENMERPSRIGSKKEISVENENELHIDSAKILRTNNSGNLVEYNTRKTSYINKSHDLNERNLKKNSNINNVEIFNEKHTREDSYMNKSFDSNKSSSKKTSYIKKSRYLNEKNSELNVDNEKNMGISRSNGLKESSAKKDSCVNISDNLNGSHSKDESFLTHRNNSNIKKLKKSSAIKSDIPNDPTKNATCISVSAYFNESNTENGSCMNGLSNSNENEAKRNSHKSNSEGIEEKGGKKISLINIASDNTENKTMKISNTGSLMESREDPPHIINSEKLSYSILNTGSHVNTSDDVRKVMGKNSKINSSSDLSENEPEKTTYMNRIDDPNESTEPISHINSSRYITENNTETEKILHIKREKNSEKNGSKKTSYIKMSHDMGGKKHSEESDIDNTTKLSINGSDYLNDSNSRNSQLERNQHLNEYDNTKKGSYMKRTDDLIENNGKVSCFKKSDYANESNPKKISHMNSAISLCERNADGFSITTSDCSNEKNGEKPSYTDRSDGLQKNFSKKGSYINSADDVNEEEDRKIFSCINGELDFNENNSNVLTGIGNMMQLSSNISVHSFENSPKEESYISNSCDIFKNNPRTTLNVKRSKDLSENNAEKIKCNNGSGDMSENTSKKLSVDKLSNFSVHKSGDVNEKDSKGGSYMNRSGGVSENKTEQIPYMDRSGGVSENNTEQIPYMDRSSGALEKNRENISYINRSSNENAKRSKMASINTRSGVLKENKSHEISYKIRSEYSKENGSKKNSYTSSVVDANEHNKNNLCIQRSGGLIEGRENDTCRNRTDGLIEGRENDTCRNRTDGLIEGRENDTCRNRTDGLIEGRENDTCRNGSGGLIEGRENDTCRNRTDGLIEGRENGTCTNRSDGLIENKNKASHTHMNNELGDIQPKDGSRKNRLISENLKPIKKLREYFVHGENDSDLLTDRMSNTSGEPQKGNLKEKNNEKYDSYDFKNITGKYKFQMNMEEDEINELQKKLKDEFQMLHAMSKKKNSLKNIFENNAHVKCMTSQEYMNNEDQYDRVDLKHSTSVNPENNFDEMSEMNSKGDLPDLKNESVFKDTQPEENWSMLNFSTEMSNREKKKIKKWKSLRMSKGYKDDWLSSDALLWCFLNYIELKKIVNITELSVKFQTKRENIRKKLKELEELDMIQGVMDKEENYIYLSQEEVTKLCMEILSIEEIKTQEDFVEICNKVISLRINDQDIQKLKEVEEKIVEANKKRYSDFT